MSTEMGIRRAGMEIEGSAFERVLGGRDNASTIDNSQAQLDRVQDYRGLSHHYAGRRKVTHGKINPHDKASIHRSLR